MAQHEQRPIVALIYDFDGTLSPGNMQEYDFIPAVGKSNREFWEESNETAREQDGDPILAYMYRMLHEAKSSGKSLRYEAFVQSGARIGLYDGVREWFSRINAYGASKGLEIHHFINSSGLREMIEGTPIAHEFRKIYACSFLYDVDGVAYWPAVAVNYTNKTQFIFKINKGIESVYDSHRINEYIEEEERPVPFRRMIYFGDGTHRHSLYAAGQAAGRTLDRRLQSLFGAQPPDERAAVARPAGQLRLPGRLPGGPPDRPPRARDYRPDRLR